MDSKTEALIEEFIEAQEYYHYLEISGRLDAEQFELGGYLDL